MARDRNSRANRSRITSDSDLRSRSCRFPQRGSLFLGQPDGECRSIHARENTPCKAERKTNVPPHAPSRFRSASSSLRKSDGGAVGGGDAEIDAQGAAARRGSLRWRRRWLRGRTRRTRAASASRRSPVSMSMKSETPSKGRSSSAGSRTCTSTTSWPRRRKWASARKTASGEVQQIRHHQHQSAAGHAFGEGFEGLAGVGAAAGFVGGEGFEEMPDVARAALGGEPAADLVVVDDQADRILLVMGEIGGRRRRVRGRTRTW